MNLPRNRNLKKERIIDIILSALILLTLAVPCIVGTVKGREPEAFPFTIPTATPQAKTHPTD